jgi:hypothetical protein
MTTLFEGMFDDAARALFTSFGSCRVLEAVDDLVALGLLPTPERISA